MTISLPCDNDERGPSPAYRPACGSCATGRTVRLVYQKRRTHTYFLNHRRRVAPAGRITLHASCVTLPARLCQSARRSGTRNRRLPSSAWRSFGREQDTPRICQCRPALLPVIFSRPNLFRSSGRFARLLPGVVGGGVYVDRSVAHACTAPRAARAHRPRPTRRA